MAGPRARSLPSDIRERGTQSAQGGGPRSRTYPDQVGARAAAGPTTRFPPTFQRPPDGSDFNPFAQRDGVDAATSPIEPAELVVQLPESSVGIIRGITLSVNDLLPTSDIIWTLLQDGSPVEGWDELTVFPRNAASVSKSWTAEETFIPVRESSQLRVRIEVRDGGSYQLGASYHGWYWPAGQYGS